MRLNIQSKMALYLASFVLGIWFLYLVRHTLTPFVLAMVFAYLFNPLINFFNRRFRLPRSLSIFVVYIILIGSFIFSLSLLTRTIITESESIRNSFETYISSIQKDVKQLPDWIQPYITDYIDYFNNNRLFGNIVFSPFPFVTKAFIGIVNFFIFLFSAFFFLKDGGKMVEKLVNVLPRRNRDEILQLFKRINDILGSYLRGQLILIASMVIMLFASFSILGVKYALTIALFSAVFEIVPFIGPLTAGVIGTFFIMISGSPINFYLTPVQIAIVSAAIYYVSRQIQDYLIAPYVIGKVTKLHPLVILFSVLAGEQIYGIIGLLLAIPIAASLKVIYGFLLEKVNNK